MGGNETGGRDADALDPDDDPFASPAIDEAASTADNPDDDNPDDDNPDNDNLDEDGLDEDGLDEDRDGARSPVARRLRSLPTAVTPVTGRDLAAGVASHLRGRGRDEFRDAITSFLDGDDAATYASYRRALGAAFRELAAGADPGQRTVLVPAFCSSDFADAIRGVGLDVRRYDVEPDTLAADLSSLRSRHVADALAVVAVNPLGYASDVASMAAFAERRDLALVETLGYALGSTYDGRRLGTYGDLAVLNFQQGKPIPVGGGMVVSRDASLSFADDGRPAPSPNVGALAGYAVVGRPLAHGVYERARAALRANGRGGTRATTHPASKSAVAYDDAFATMSNFQGAVAKRVFERLPETRRQRARTAQFYRRAFADFEYARPITPLPGLEGHGWIRYPLLVESNELRGELRRTLRKHGIQVPLLYNWPKVRREEFPGARTLQRRILPLPTHPYVDDHDRQEVVDVVRDVAEAYADRL